MNQKYKSQSQQVFDSLEEAILVVQDGVISFMNDEFKSILKPFQRENMEIEELKLFKSMSQEEAYTINEVIKRPQQNE